MDLKNMVELFNALVEEVEEVEEVEGNNKTTKIEWDLIILGALFLLGLYFLYKSNSIGGNGVDFSSFTRVLPETKDSVTATELNPDFDPEFAALLDKVFNANTSE